MRQPEIILLIRRRERLRIVLAAIPSINDPTWSAGRRQADSQAFPIRRELADLDRRIGERPKFWMPRRQDKRDKIIARQYAESER